MNINRHFHSFAARAFNPQCWLGAAKRKGLQLATLSINLLLLSVVLVVADHLPFIDVPSGAFYHNAVSAVFGARITTGTTPTTFSPDDFVTRGQMAVFLHRGLGRVAYDEGSDTSIVTTNREMASVTIDTGGAIGGAGFLKVDATLTIYNYRDSGCPCNIRYYLDASDGPNSPYHHLFIDANPVAVLFGNERSGAVTWVFPVETGSIPQRVRLMAKVDNSMQNSTLVFGKGSISAIYVPFGATGGNTISAASIGQGDAPQGMEPDGKPDPQR